MPLPIFNGITFFVESTTCTRETSPLCSLIRSNGGKCFNNPRDPRVNHLVLLSTPPGRVLRFEAFPPPKPPRPYGTEDEWTAIQLIKDFGTVSGLILSPYPRRQIVGPDWIQDCIRQGCVRPTQKYIIRGHATSGEAKTQAATSQQSVPAGPPKILFELVRYPKDQYDAVFTPHRADVISHHPRGQDPAPWRSQTTISSRVASPRMVTYEPRLDMPCEKMVEDPQPRDDRYNSSSWPTSPGKVYTGAPTHSDETPKQSLAASPSSDNADLQDFHDHDTRSALLDFDNEADLADFDDIPDYDITPKLEIEDIAMGTVDEEAVDDGSKVRPSLFSSLLGIPAGFALLCPPSLAMKYKVLIEDYGGGRIVPLDTATFIVLPPGSGRTPNLLQNIPSLSVFANMDQGSVEKILRAASESSARVIVDGRWIDECTTLGQLVRLADYVISLE